MRRLWHRLRSAWRYYMAPVRWTMPYTPDARLNAHRLQAMLWEAHHQFPSKRIAVRLPSPLLLEGSLQFPPHEPGIWLVNLSQRPRSGG